MTMLLTRKAADTLLAEFDLYVRMPRGEGPDGGDTDGGAPLPSGEGAVLPEDIPEDPEAVKEMVLAEIREQLGWDGTGGDPNASLAALEDALADMFDADVEIVWDGESQLTLRVEGEEPALLTPDFLGGLLEELARPGAVEEDGEDESAQADGQERGHDGRRRGMGKFTPDLHPRDPGGEGGGQFVKKGTTAAGAVTTVAKAAGKAAKGAPPSTGAGKGPSGPQPSTLASRAKGRAGPHITSKAVGKAFSASSGQRVRVSGNKDGSFNVGPRKQKMSGKKVAAVMIASWLAFGLGAGFLAATLGLPLAAVAGVAAVTQIALLVKLLRSR